MMTPDSPTDLELVRGLHARDRQAFACVYGDYHAAVYNLCARILGDREEAKDVTQDVFLKAFDRPPAASADVRLRPWLFRVATNACFNLVRGRRTGGPLEVEALPAVGDPYEQARSAELIEGSLAAMNERYRAALVLKDLHGVGSSELAEVLAISRPAADVLVHRARASFRRAFAALAGDGAAAPANLALVLPRLERARRPAGRPTSACCACARHARPGARRPGPRGSGSGGGRGRRPRRGHTGEDHGRPGRQGGGGRRRRRRRGRRRSDGCRAHRQRRHRSRLFWRCAGGDDPTRHRRRRARRPPQLVRRLGRAPPRDRRPPRREQPLRPCRSRDEPRALHRPCRGDCPRRDVRRRPYGVDVLGSLDADVFRDDDARHNDIDHIHVLRARRRRAGA